VNLLERIANVIRSFTKNAEIGLLNGCIIPFLGRPVKRPLFGSHLAVLSNGAEEDFGTQGASLGGGSACHGARKSGHVRAH
jgi:hypothetical protein